MRYGLIGSVLAALLLTSCVADTKNVGPRWTEPPHPIVGVTVPSDMAGGEEATWEVYWFGGGSPVTIAMDMGGGTTENVQFSEPVTSPYTYTFTMVNGSRDYDATYTYTVTLMVTDYGSTGTASGTYTVGPIPNNPPSIDDITFENGILTVYVSDVDGDDMWVSITEPAGIATDDRTKRAEEGIAQFNIWCTDIIAGASGTVEITVDDNNGGIDTEEFTITIDPIVIPAGALAAIPVVDTATTADTVTVVVISGEFSQPFQYMNGVGITVENGAAYVDGTLNVGTVGGGQLDPDGLWADMSPSPDSFLLPNDFIIQEFVIWGDEMRIDFNITPIGGANTYTGGAIFNFGMSFDHAGTYHLGFEEFRDVKRTYYSDHDSQEYNWDDISNDYPDVPNSIVVT